MSPCVFLHVSYLGFILNSTYLTYHCQSETFELTNGLIRNFRIYQMVHIMMWVEALYMKDFIFIVNSIFKCNYKWSDLKRKFYIVYILSFSAKIFSIFIMCQKMIWLITYIVMLRLCPRTTKRWRASPRQLRKMFSSLTSMKMKGMDSWIIRLLKTTYNDLME